MAHLAERHAFIIGSATDNLSLQHRDHYSKLQCHRKHSEEPGPCSNFVEGDYLGVVVIVLVWFALL